MDSAPNPYRGPVADLVDPYAERANEETREAIRRIKDWMRQHPGRWCCIAEGEMGVNKANFEDEFEVKQKGWKKGVLIRVFARMPHRQGESLESALAKTPSYGYSELPELERDPFDWTPEELADAVRYAREEMTPSPRARAARKAGRREAA